MFGSLWYATITYHYAQYKHRKPTLYTSCKQYDWMKVFQIHLKNYWWHLFQEKRPSANLSTTSLITFAPPSSLFCSQLLCEVSIVWIQYHEHLYIAASCWNQEHGCDGRRVVWTLYTWRMPCTVLGLLIAYCNAWDICTPHWIGGLSIAGLPPSVNSWVSMF